MNILILFSSDLVESFPLGLWMRLLDHIRPFTYQDRYIEHIFSVLPQFALNYHHCEPHSGSPVRDWSSFSLLGAKVRVGNFCLLSLNFGDPLLKAWLFSTVHFGCCYVRLKFRYIPVNADDLLANISQSSKHIIYVPDLVDVEEFYSGIGSFGSLMIFSFFHDFSYLCILYIGLLSIFIQLFWEFLAKYFQIYFL